MLKKVFKTTIASVLSLSLLSTFGETAQAEEKLNLEQIEEIHNEMYELVLDNREDEIKDLESYKEMSESFEENPEIYEEYLKNVDVNNDEQIEKALEEVNKEINLLDNEDKKEVVQLEDGSFIVVETKVEEIKNPETEGMVKAATVSNFGDRKHTYTYKRYHIGFPDTTCVLVTNFNLSKNGINIFTTSNSGSYAIIPVTLVRSSKVVTQYAKSAGSIARSQGDFLLSYGGYKGIALFSENRTLRTNIKLNKINSSSVDYTITTALDK